MNLKIKLSVCCNYKVITIPTFMGHLGCHNCDKCKKECEIHWMDFEPYEIIANGIKRPKIEQIKKYGFDPIKFLAEINKL